MLVSQHPSKLLPNAQLVPLFDPALDLPVSNLKGGIGVPGRFVACRFDAIVRLTVVAT